MWSRMKLLSLTLPSLPERRTGARGFVVLPADVSRPRSCSVHPRIHSDPRGGGSLTRAPAGYRNRRSLSK